MSAIPQPLHAASDTLDLRRVAGRIGAEIRGVALSGDLDAGTVAAIRAALVTHKVLFFRDQNLDEAGQEAFGRRLGELVPHPTVPSLPGTAGVLDLDGSRGERASSWHTDVTFVPAYPAISILRAVTLPAYGGDTLWANTAAAYAELPEPLRDLADKLWALHSNVYDYVGGRVSVPEGGRRRYDEVFTRTVYETEHPLVHVHPESGERSLIVGHFIQRILGLTTSDSQHLLAIFHDHATRPENTVRWTWRAGDVAIWDNRATVHRAVDDYDDQPRVVRRVTIQGVAPVSVDGQRSRARETEARKAA
ncbi:MULTISPECIES: TauD/TfdA dioxygenase family protein [unclassified Methylobacterium]|jgi:alpha-ketoglutarate-dependent sulfate ester dioxygenase|uniref:TauD/TfdA dioxygenase family protein n=1 Tax=unclassified Methylobacterium TaxID=2615210 RepID=UPI001354666B|nr:TauD/TfdA family dioxygenase [Methylobacterium sp. 2A]MWV20796.1 TauD/TfdA family dioxygenase [Methylobacterium sp. 2A]